MERPERIVLIILGALFNRWGAMAPALWVLAVLSTVTVIHRIRYTYLETERRRLHRLATPDQDLRRRTNIKASHRCTSTNAASHRARPLHCAGAWRSLSFAN